jgi:hypothetical protein
VPPPLHEHEVLVCGGRIRIRPSRLLHQEVECILRVDAHGKEREQKCRSDRPHRDEIVHD